MIRAVVVRWTGFALFWLAMTAGARDGLVFGALAAAAATWSSMRLLPPGEFRVRWPLLLTMLPRFLWHGLVAGIDIARRAFDPRLPLQPGYIAYPVKFRHSDARNAFAAMTSLLPGTVPCADEDGVLIYHCLDVSQPVAAQLAADEARLARVIAELADG